MGFSRIGAILPSSLKHAVASAPPSFSSLVAKLLPEFPEGTFRLLDTSFNTLTVACGSMQASGRLRAVQRQLLAAMPGNLTHLRVMLSTWR